MSPSAGLQGGLGAVPAARVHGPLPSFFIRVSWLSSGVLFVVYLIPLHPRAPLGTLGAVA